MNYFGMFFTFMVPGMIIGTMAALGAKEAAERRRRQQRRRRRAAMHAVPKNKLYICTIDEARAA